MIPRSAHRIFSVVLFLAMLSWGCNQKAPSNGAEAIVGADQGGDFRGIYIGDEREQVMRKESAETVYTMPDELIYRTYPSGVDSTWYEITYNFNEQGLYDISLDVFPKSTSESHDLKGHFVAYYKQRYGECTLSNGYCTWRAMTINGHLVSITLTDSLAYNNKPCLRVNFNESHHEH